MKNSSIKSVISTGSGSGRLYLGTNDCNGCFYENDEVYQMNFNGGHRLPVTTES